MNAPADIKLVCSFATHPGSSGYRMHNAAYKALGLNYLYLPRRYNGEVAHVLQAIKTIGIHGASLTMPYKTSCIPHLDSLSDEAKAVGAVNTVLNQAGKLIGYNTDSIAAQKLIASLFVHAESPLLILGAGGMAHAFAYAAQQLKRETYISARDQHKASALANRFNAHTVPWLEFHTMPQVILCNATPLGMPGYSDSWNTEILCDLLLAGIFDATVNPVDTPLIQLAKEKSVPYIDGRTLALEQACEQFLIYTGQPAPKEVMKEALYA